MSCFDEPDYDFDEAEEALINAGFVVMYPDSENDVTEYLELMIELLKERGYTVIPPED